MKCDALAEAARAIAQEGLNRVRKSYQDDPKVRLTGERIQRCGHGHGRSVIAAHRVDRNGDGSEAGQEEESCCAEYRRRTHSESDLSLRVARTFLPR